MTIIGARTDGLNGVRRSFRLWNAALFQQLVASDSVKQLAGELFARGFQTRGPLELDLGDGLVDLTEAD